MSRSVTFLLTEVPDSTERWERDERAMASATARLDDLVRRCAAEHRGTLVKPRGEGDSHFLTFDHDGGDPGPAVACAVDFVGRAAEASGLAVRAAVHVGPAEFRDGDWYGTTVNRCARLRAAAHPGQIVVSATVAAAVAGTLPGVGLRSLGLHRLKDLDEPVEVFGVVAPGLAADFPPLSSLARRHGLPIPPTSFVGRDDELSQVAELLAAGGTVTITGAAGVGKTRFALEAAARWFAAHGEPVVLVREPWSQVEPRRGLTLIDDADTLAGPPPSGGGPVLITSRGPRGWPAERVLRLAPLDEHHMARLLEDRVPDGVPAPAALAPLLDGLPLAAELLARRAAMLSPEDLAARLDAAPLAVLAGNRGADPPRHASMRAALEWGWHRLSERERDELRSLAGDRRRWVAAGWLEPSGPSRIVSAFLRPA